MTLTASTSCFVMAGARLRKKIEQVRCRGRGAVGVSAIGAASAAAPAGDADREGSAASLEAVSSDEAEASFSCTQTRKSLRKEWQS